MGGLTICTYCAILYKVLGIWSLVSMLCVYVCILEPMPTSG